MNHLQKLEEILKKCIDMGWIPFEGFYDNKILRTKYIECKEDGMLHEIQRGDDGPYYRQYSYNDLFSIESGLLQLVKWKQKGDFIALLSWGGHMKEKYETYGRKHHAMQMSILPVDQKIEYFIKNIDI